MPMYQVSSAPNGTELGQSMMTEVKGIGPISMSATGDFFRTPLNVSNYKNCSFQITGTFIGIISVTGSIDGVNFTPIKAIPLSGGQCASIMSTQGIWSMALAVEYVKFSVTSYTSGTITLTARFSTEGTTDYKNVMLPTLPNGPIAGPSKVISVTTTAQDIDIPVGTSLMIIKIRSTSACGYVGYRFKYPGSTDAVLLGNNGTHKFDLEPGQFVIEAPVDGATALSIACDANTATGSIFFRT
jgi:hypothetical protein